MPASSQFPGSAIGPPPTRRYGPPQLSATATPVFITPGFARERAL